MTFHYTKVGLTPYAHLGLIWWSPNHVRFWRFSACWGLDAN